MREVNCMKKPNFLFISTDYQRGVDLPSFGSPFLKMPNVDRLCENGIVYLINLTSLSLDLESNLINSDGAI